MLLALLAASRLFARLLTDESFSVLGVQVPHAAIWAGLLFLLLAAVAFLVAFGVPTGIKGLDARIHKLIDLLIDTEQELNKVSWPNRDELTRSTTAVLVTILMVGGYIFCVGIVILYVMSSLSVLPG